MLGSRLPGLQYLMKTDCVNVQAPVLEAALHFETEAEAWLWVTQQLETAIDQLLWMIGDRAYPPQPQPFGAFKSL